jgi:hypothetical protein
MYRGHIIVQYKNIFDIADTYEERKGVRTFRTPRDQSAGIGIRFLEKSRRCGGFGAKFLGDKIRRGVIRGYRVVARG